MKELIATLSDADTDTELKSVSTAEPKSKAPTNPNPDVVSLDAFVERLFTRTDGNASLRRFQLIRALASAPEIATALGLPKVCGYMDAYICGCIECMGA